MRRPAVCPTCLRPLAPPLVVNGPVRQRVINIIADRPDGITRAELMALVYASDPNGGPEWPNTISVIIKNANKDLAPQGYHIAATRGRGARYRLFRAGR